MTPKVDERALASESAGFWWERAQIAAQVTLMSRASVLYFVIPKTKFFLKFLIEYIFSIEEIVRSNVLLV